MKRKEIDKFYKTGKMTYRQKFAQMANLAIAQKVLVREIQNWYAEKDAINMQEKIAYNKDLLLFIDLVFATPEHLESLFLTKSAGSYFLANDFSAIEL